MLEEPRQACEIGRHRNLHEMTLRDEPRLAQAAENRAESDAEQHDDKTRREEKLAALR